jgi:hypothetical protein
MLNCGQWERFRAIALVIAACVAAAATSATAQGGPASGRAQTPSKSGRAPASPDGHPDLTGVWSFASATPLERPAQFANKPVLTDAEAAEFVKNLPMDGCRLVKCDGTAKGNLDSAYGAEWWELGSKMADNRTSLVIDPPDGRIPPLTPEAAKRVAALRALSPSNAAIAGPEDATVTDRCLVGFNSGPPMNPSAYNNLVQIFQTATHVVILNEMIHNARIIPIDGRSHLPDSVRQWVGDSRGRWEGDTLVVETTNFRRDSLAGPGGAGSVNAQSFRLTERFSRTKPDTLQYEYTMNDPTTWTKPWTVRVPMEKSANHLYEYACHEGNYSMPNRLSAARADDRKTGEKQDTTGK